jgi:hypothetical protein
VSDANLAGLILAIAALVLLVLALIFAERF